jgi:predicted amidophosphoribosyltransferase
VEAKTVFNAIGELFLGAECAGCHRSGIGLCPECREVLGLGAGMSSYAQTQISWGGLYSGVLRNILLNAKERKALGMIGVLGDLLVAATEPLLTHRKASYTLVPVPTAKKNVIERGLDLTLTLANRTASTLRRQGYSVNAAPALRFARRPADQSTLNATQRRENLYRAFYWQSRTPPTRVIIVDDIFTTGATAGEAIRAVRAAGDSVAGATFVARTPHRP